MKTTRVPLARRLVLDNIFLNKIDPRSNNHLLFFLFALYFLNTLFVLIPTASIMVDEGWAADIGNSLLEGKTLYKDISAPYGPIVFYVYAMVIFVFGKQFLVLRIIGSLIIILLAFLSYMTTKKIVGNNWLAIIAPAMILMSVGSYQGARITAATIAGLLSISILYNHISYIQSKHPRHLVYMGLLLVFSLLTKHNIFAFDVAANVLVILGTTISSIRQKRKIDYQYLYLVPLSFLLFLTPYILVVFPYYHNILDNTVFQIGGYSSSMQIPFPPPLHFSEMNLFRIFRSLFFYSIFPIMISFGIVARKSHTANNINAEMWLVFFLGLFQYLQIFPLSDYSHYVRATIVFPILIAILLERAILQDLRIAFRLTVIGVMLHLYVIPLHQINSMRRQLNASESRLPYNANIKAIPGEAEMLEILESICDAGDTNILVIGHHNYIYYLSDKPHVSKFSLVSHHYLNSIEDERVVIREIQLNDVGLIIEGAPLREVRDFDELSVLGSYVKDNFTICRTFNGFNIWCDLDSASQ